MSEFHALAGKRLIMPEDMEGCTLLAPGANLKLLRYFQMYLEGHGIKVDFQSIANDRYPIIEGLNQGCIYMANKDLAHNFLGYSCVPLDFDTHVKQGLACREEMYELYNPFFDIAHSLGEEK